MYFFIGVSISTRRGFFSALNFVSFADLSEGRVLVICAISAKPIDSFKHKPLEKQSFS